MSDRKFTVFDWSYDDPQTGHQVYARTPERAKQLASEGVKLTPVYTLDLTSEGEAADDDQPEGATEYPSVAEMLSDHSMHIEPGQVIEWGGRGRFVMGDDGGLLPYSPPPTPASGEQTEAPKPAQPDLERYNFYDWTPEHGYIDEPLVEPDGTWVKYTDAQAHIAALTAKVEEAEKVCDSYADENQRLSDRAETAEARVAELEKALKPFAFLADCSEREPVGASVMVNVERCRDARSALHPEREG